MGVSRFKWQEQFQQDKLIEPQQISVQFLVTMKTESCNHWKGKSQKKNKISFTCWCSRNPDVMCCTTVSNRFTHKTWSEAQSVIFTSKVNKSCLQVTMSGRTHGESAEQVCKHLGGQRAFPPTHEGVQSVSEEAGDPIYVHVTHKPQLHKITQTHKFRLGRKSKCENKKFHAWLSFWYFRALKSFKLVHRDNKSIWV